MNLTGAHLRPRRMRLAQNQQKNIECLNSCIVGVSYYETCFNRTMVVLKVLSLSLVPFVACGQV